MRLHVLSPVSTLVAFTRYLHVRNVIKYVGCCACSKIMNEVFLMQVCIAGHVA